MGGYFSDITSLNPLSDDIIDEYNKNEYITGGVFYGCSSLTYLPDISKWNVSHFTEMSSVFWVQSIVNFTRYFKMEYF